jgi:hypothetical protein
MRSYRLRQRGPISTEDTEISLERATRTYRVKTKAHKNGQEKVPEGTLDLPPNVYNGMVLTIAKNLPKGASETVHMVAFTPAPRLIKLEVTPVDEHKALIGDLTKPAIHYLLQASARKLAQALRHVARSRATGLSGLDRHRRGAGIREVRGATYATGPVWRVEVTSPRGPTSRGGLLPPAEAFLDY